MTEAGDFKVSRALLADIQNKMHDAAVNMKELERLFKLALQPDKKPAPIKTPLRSPTGRVSKCVEISASLESKTS